MEDGRCGLRMKMNYQCSVIVLMSGKQYFFKKKCIINLEGVWVNGECVSDLVD